MVCVVCAVRVVRVVRALPKYFGHAEIEVGAALLLARASKPECLVTTRDTHTRHTRHTVNTPFPRLPVGMGTCLSQKMVEKKSTTTLNVPQPSLSMLRRFSSGSGGTN